MPDFGSFRTKNFTIFLTFLFLQQCIVGSSNLLLSEAAEQAATLGPWFLKIVLLYGVSLLIPYAVGSFAGVFLKRWEYELIEIWNKKIFDQFHSKPFLWRNPSAKNSVNSVRTREIPAFTQTFVHFVYDSLSGGLNVLVNVVSFVWVLGASFGAAFGIGILLSLVLSRMGSRNLQTLASSWIAQRIRWTDLGQLFWDNVVLGNQPCKSLWDNQEQNQMGELSKKATRLAERTQLQNTITTIVAFVPVLILLIYKLHEHSADPSYCVAAVALLPRMLQALNSANVVFATVSKTSEIKGSIETIRSELDNALDSQAEPLIVWEKIVVSSGESTAVPISTPQDLLSLVLRSKRVLIRGENGAGKSSALLLLKTKIRDAVLIPAKSDGLIFSISGPEGVLSEKLSTGQMHFEQLRRAIQMIATRSQSEQCTLLLDEWDANLDRTKILEIEAELQFLEQKGCQIVEVRHRK